jgi:hypothetical protein
MMMKVLMKNNFTFLNVAVSGSATWSREPLRGHLVSISRKVNVLSTPMHNGISGSIFYQDIMTSNSFVHLLESYALLWLGNSSNILILHWIVHVFNLLTLSPDCLNMNF